ncbi:MAG TPA: hypothetical protein VHJ99_02025 [Candidatus Dormibacteraeota bacterium]|nr:hypothetical protein [Candidatus Dormibacteraeota bacterium]
MNRTLPLKDRLRIELVVRRLDYVLDGRVPMARRRQIRSELRSNLIEAAQQVGAAQAIEQLGDLKALAHSYLELYRGRFDFQAGSWAAVATYAAIQLLAIILLLAFHAGVAAGGAHAGSYSFEFWNGFGPFAGSVSANGSSFVMLMLSPAHVLLMLIAFVIGSSYRTIFARR